MDKIIILLTIGAGLLFAYRRVRRMSSEFKQRFREGKEKVKES